MNEYIIEAANEVWEYCEASREEIKHEKSKIIAGLDNVRESYIAMAERINVV